MKLHWQIFLALFIGSIFGYFFTEQVVYIGWIGDTFISLLKMVIVPLVLTSIITGVANIGTQGNFKKLGITTLLYYLSTSILAILTGLIVVNIVQPGVGADLGLAQTVSGLDMAGKSFGDTLKNVVPTNVFDALATGQMLSIIFMAVLAGLFIPKLDKKNEAVVLNFMNATFELVMKITNFIIKLTPYGVFAIIAVTVANQLQSGNIAQLLQSMGKYMFSVIIALAIHAFILLPLLLKLVAKYNPLKHVSNMRVPLITAFSTSSSSATLPLTMDAIENKSGVSNTTTSFVLPLGATVNMDGTALYECVAAMFIAQAYGMDMTITKQIIVVATALIASIGAAGIPMAGMVMISVVLTAIGLPLEGVGLILAVDRILDMFRTAVNVWSDSCGAIVVAKLQGEQLP